MNIVLEKYSVFLDDLYNEIAKTGINVQNLKLDHIAFRTNTPKEYEELLSQFLELGDTVHENYISGNTVKIFKLFEPLKYKNQSMDALEFIGPNENIDYPTGFEHAEFTITEDFEEFANRHPSLSWDKQAVNRKDFPMLKLPLKPFMQVKFNHIPVLDMAKTLNH